VSSTPSQNDPAPPRSGTGRLRWIVLLAAAVLAFLYFVPIPFIAYTSDAYVRSDFVEIAPQVSGVVNHVDVANDQKVAVGNLLATLDPEPFALAVDLDQKRFDVAAAASKEKEEEAGVLASALETAKAAVTLAQQDYDRIAALVKQGAVAQTVQDRSVEDRQKALDAVTGVEAKLRVNAGEVASALAEVAVAKAQLSLAQYNLSRTRLVAPVPGFVTNLSLRPGDYANRRSDHRHRR
jgi:membrane fusion protein, multidrug efflux system